MHSQGALPIKLCTRKLLHAPSQYIAIINGSKNVHTPGAHLLKSCTRPRKCARRVQGAPLISDTAVTNKITFWPFTSNAHHPLVSWSDLGRMYQLVSRIQDGLRELKTLLESHIYNQGLAAIEKCGEPALNVSSIDFYSCSKKDVSFNVYIVLSSVEKSKVYVLYSVMEHFPNNLLFVYFRPSSNEKLFPVHRPSGLKRANWNLFFIFSKKYVFPFAPVHSSLRRKKNRKKKKKSDRPTDWPFFCPTGPQETIIHLSLTLCLDA